MPFGLKYEQYERLSLAQRREYDFCFREHNDRNGLATMLNISMVLIMISSFFLLTGLLLLTNKEIIKDYFVLVQSSLSSGNRVISYAGAIIFISILYSVIENLVFMNSWMKWKKKNVLKVVVDGKK